MFQATLNTDYAQGIFFVITSYSIHYTKLYDKAIANAEITRKKYPERNPYLMSPKTLCEQIMYKFLTDNNIEFKFRFIIEGYFVNFYLPIHNICIDIVGKNRLPLSYKRHNTILEQDYGIVYCITDFVKKSNFSDLYNYITSLNIIGSVPSFERVTGMVNYGGMVV